MRNAWIKWSLTGWLGGLWLLAACSSGGEEPDVPPTPQANRTVLVYMMAENSLSDYAEKDTESDLHEILQGAASIPDGDHLLVFLDDANSLQLPRIYEITKGTKNAPANAKTVKAYDTEVCSTDPAVLQDVLAYVKKTYPANGYGLILWSHGSGWTASKKVKDSRSIGIDNENNTTSNNGVEMEISSLNEVLRQFGKLDFLYFDACYMQGIEVAYALRNATSYLIGSPAETPGTGSRYDRIVTSLFKPSAEAAAIGILENNYAYYEEIFNQVPDTERGNSSNPLYWSNFGCIQSVVKCSELEALAAATRPLIEPCASPRHLLPLVESRVQSYRGASLSYPDFYDMSGVIYNISTDEEYAVWKAQLDRTVIAHKHTPYWYSNTGWCTVKEESVSPFSGISMYVPKNDFAYTNKWTPDFHHTAWFEAVWSATGW